MKIREYSEYNNDIERIFDLLKNGYSYLFDCASKTGHWKEARCSSLAAMCLQIREDGRSVWLRSIRNWLKETQIKEDNGKGSWGEEVWDTAMCVLALKDLEVSSKDSSIESALNWLEKLFPLNGRNNWHDEPWETSWALMAILRCGREVKNVNISSAIKWLSNFQSSDGKIISPHYTAYFLLISEFSLKASLPVNTRKIIKITSEKCATYLNKELELSDKERLWTGEAWSNGQILWALNLAGVFPIANKVLVDKCVSWFELNQTPKGNWSDVEDTASAILGLYVLLQNLAVESVKGNELEKNLLDRLERRLRKGVPVPRLQIKKKFVEINNEIGYISFNITQKTAKLFSTILGFIFVVLVGWLADMMALLGEIWKYLNPK